MRWNHSKLYEVTGKKTKAAQARWFKNILDTDVPVDAFGVLMCDSAYEALIQRKCGLSHDNLDSPIKNKKHLPELRL